MGTTALTSTTFVTENVMNAFTSAVSQIATDVGSMVTAALPYGLGIMGTFLVIGLGIKFFKSIAH